NKFTLPPHLTLANLAAQGQGEKAQMAPGGAPVPGHSNASGLAQYVVDQVDPSLTWDVIHWLRSITTLPIIVKGVMTAEDAALAVQHGVDAIVVSNHGGRQSDCCLSTIEALPEVIAGVADRVPVYLDGGIRRGSDVFKALALGARACFIGRPVLWALTCGGEQGVRDMLQLLEDEFKLTMALAGCSNLSQITRRHVILPSERAGIPLSHVVPAKL
ncbi:hypothetical protein IWQ60_009313, partial [Tieghemiomyces parasiticus]